MEDKWFKFRRKNPDGTVRGPIPETAVIYDDEEESYQVISSELVNVTVDTVVDNPLLTMEDCKEEMVECMIEMTADKGANFPNPKTFRHMEQFDVVAHEMGKVSEYEFIARPAKHRQSQISRLFTSPLAAYASNELSHLDSQSIVLILGAGFGRDIDRLQKSNNNLRRFVCVEPNRSRAESMRCEYKGVDVINKTVADAIPEIMHRGPYDFILANMSFHYIFGVRSAESFVDILPSIMKPKSSFYGSYVDINTLSRLTPGKAGLNTISLNLLGKTKDFKFYGDEPRGEVMRVDMCGRIYVDPILDINDLFCMFAKTPLTLNIVDGTQMLFGTAIHSEGGKPALYPPSFPVDYMPELSVYRAVIITHPRVARLRDKFVVPPPKWEKMVGNANIGLRHINCEYNRGVPMQPYQTRFLIAGQGALAEKLDGTLAKVVHMEDGVYVVVEHPRALYRIANRLSDVGDFVLQAELVGPDDAKQIYVTDVLCTPYGTHGIFVNRWNWFLNMLHDVNVDSVVLPVVPQEYIDIGDPSVLVLVGAAVEGVVFQPYCAPPGIIREGRGSAEYVKRVWTVDVSRGDKIVEVDLNDRYIRDRPDKNEPNTQHYIRKVRAAITYSAFYLWLVKYHSSSDDRVTNELQQLIIDGVPLDEWDNEMKVAFYFRLYDDLLEEKYAVALERYRIDFVIMCRNRAEQIVDDEYKELRSVVPVDLLAFNDDEVLDDEFDLEEGPTTPAYKPDKSEVDEFRRILDGAFKGSDNMSKKEIKKICKELRRVQPRGGLRACK